MLLKIGKKPKSSDEYVSILLKTTYLLMIFLCLYSSNWEVDPLHEGLTFPTAVAIAEGKTIFRDIHSQYGLLQPIIEGFIISITGPYLIVQRLVGSICIILISILIYLCSKNLTTVNPYIPAIVYLALSPNWNYVSSIEVPLARNPWPNSYGILFQMACIYLFILYQKELKNYQLLLSGIALGISAFARIQFTMISLLLIIFIIFLIRVEKNWNYSWIIFGYSSTFFIFLILLMQQGALGSMYNQIIGALFDEGFNSVRAPTISVAAKTLFVLIIILVIYLTIIRLIRNKYLHISLLYFGTIALTYVVYPKSTEYGGKFFSLIKLISENIVLSPIYFLVAACTLVTIIQIFSALKNKFYRRELVQSNSIYLFICAVSFLNLIQMHILSSVYYYLVIPTYLVLFFGYHLKVIRSFFASRFFKFTDNSMLLTLLSVIVCISLTNYLFILNKESSYYSAPILKHMKSYNANVYLKIDNITIAMSRLPSESTVSVNCLYGLYSVNQNGYLSKSKYYWNYLPSKLLEEKTELEMKFPADYLINCIESPISNGRIVYNKSDYIEIERFKINEDEILTLSKKTS